MNNLEKNNTNLSPKTQKTYNKIIKCAKKEFASRGYLNTSISSQSQNFLCEFRLV